MTCDSHGYNGRLSDHHMVNSLATCIQNEALNIPSPRVLLCPALSTEMVQESLLFQTCHFIFDVQGLNTQFILNIKTVVVCADINKVSIIALYD